MSQSGEEHIISNFSPCDTLTFPLSIKAIEVPLSPQLRENRYYSRSSDIFARISNFKEPRFQILLLIERSDVFRLVGFVYYYTGVRSLQPLSKNLLYCLPIRD